MRLFSDTYTYYWYSFTGGKGFIYGSCQLHTSQISVRTRGPSGMNQSHGTAEVQIHSNVGKQKNLNGLAPTITQTCA